MWVPRLDLQSKLTVSAPGDACEQEADRVTDQVMSMPAHVSDGNTPAHLEHSEGHNERNCEAAPAKVDPALTGAGMPLDQPLRRDMEQRFGHDFSRVRVHADMRATASARAAGASAYAVGHHLVFDSAQYRPSSTEGRRLLAHELTHVLQQARGAAPPSVQRQQAPQRRPPPVDVDGQRIIDLAQDASKPIDERAVAVIRAIINQYYPNDASKITRITYREGEPGLHITYAGRGTATTGQIEVGRYFVEHTDRSGFARRLAQVRHEIEHVDQQRAGMSGESRQDEREFIAFYHEALFQEPAGAGRLQHATRVHLIDAALGYYHCLSSELQQANTTRRDELLARRADAAQRSGRSDLGQAPTACRRQRH